MSPICPQQWSDTDLRLLFLTELTACIGDDFVLVGAHARDVVWTSPWQFLPEAPVTPTVSPDWSRRGPTPDFCFRKDRQCPIASGCPST